LPVRPTPIRRTIDSVCPIVGVKTDKSARFAVKNDESALFSTCSMRACKDQAAK